MTLLVAVIGTVWAVQRILRCGGTDAERRPVWSILRAETRP